MLTYQHPSKTDWLRSSTRPRPQAIQELCKESEDDIHDLELQVKATRNKYTNLVKALTREHSEGTEEGCEGN